MSVEKTLTFFNIAKPSPTSKDFFLQTAYNFEEWSEVVEAIGAKDSEMFETLLNVKQELIEDMSEQPEANVKKAYKQVDRLMLADGIADSIVTLVGMAYMAGIDIENVFKEVAASNLSKFVKVSGELNSLQEETFGIECNIIEGQGRYKGVTWSRKGDYIVFTDQNGKIVKPTSFFEPDLKKFIKGE